MNLLDHAHHLLGRIRGKLGLPQNSRPDLAITAARGDDLAEFKQGDLAKIFFEHRGRTVHKWLHYLEIYEQHFSQYRNTGLTMLEIGVQAGGSLQLWRSYFGPSANLFGIDIDPSCANVADPPTKVRIGSQDDPEFLQAVLDEMGAPDIILDDGSHIGRHQVASFEVLFPALKNGGLYVIEDLHASYWPGYLEGGYRRKGTGIEFIKSLMDDMHGWYHRRPVRRLAKESIKSIQIYDSIAVIEKGTKIRPGHIKTGGRD